MRMQPIFLSVTLLAMLKLPFGCGEHKAQSNAPATAGTNAPAARVSASQSAAVKPLPVPENGPSVAIISPAKNETVDSSDVGVFLKVQNLPADAGGHLHVMLDNQAPVTPADPMLPIVFHRVKPGLHVLRAFACDANHRSFKNRTAFGLTWFKVAGVGDAESFDPSLPTLTFNLPGAACSSATAKNLPVDFLIDGLPLGDIDAWRVRVVVDGEPKLLVNAGNYNTAVLPPLDGGTHAVRLELLDGREQPVRANFGWSERMLTTR